jgi:hypothetical protein
MKGLYPCRFREMAERQGFETWMESKSLKLHLACSTRLK